MRFGEAKRMAEHPKRPRDLSLLAKLMVEIVKVHFPELDQKMLKAALDQFYKLENQSEEKINKIREPAAAVARKLLGS